MADTAVKSTAMKSLGGVLARQGILVAFIVFMVGFTLWNPRFIDIDNVFGVVRSSAILGIMALGVTFVVISGNLDLSVGSMMSFSTIVVLDLHDNPIRPGAGHPCDVRDDARLGAIIGFLIGYLRLNSLIVTLGMLSAIHGLTLTYSGGQNMDIANKARPGSTSSGAARRWAFRCRS
jgi:ribose/xylose/arabinose/galactoside ABC-type transport system permease subunit